MPAQCEISIGIDLDDVLAVAVPPEAPGIVADGPPVADEPPAADILHHWQEHKVRTYPHIHNSPNTIYDLLVRVSVSFDFWDTRRHATQVGVDLSNSIMTYLSWTCLPKKLCFGLGISCASWLCNQQDRSCLTILAY